MVDKIPVLPKSMTLHGFAINTGGPGNGLWFNHEQMASVVGQKAHFVADHDSSIQSIAGTVEFDAAKRKKIKVPYKKPKKNGKEFEEGHIEESSTLLGFKAELSPMFNGYEKVARNVLALREMGRVPNVSVWVYGTSISFDKDTDRVFLDGPYTMRHLGQVDLGAFSDEVGVGVFDVDIKNSLDGFESPTFALMGQSSVLLMNGETEGAPVGVPCSVSVMMAVRNSEKAMSDFVEKYLESRPDVVERVGRALGYDFSDAEVEETAETKKGPYKSQHSSTPSGAQVDAEVHITDGPQMTDKTPETPENLAKGGPAPEPSKGLTEDAVRSLIASELKSRDDKILELTRERDSVRAEQRVKVVAARLGLSDEEAKPFSALDEAALAKVEATLKRPNMLHMGDSRGILAGLGQDAESKFQSRYEEASKWHASRYLGEDAPGATIKKEV